MGDVFFDLANFSVNNGLSKDETAGLLRAYFGDVRPEHERALTLMRYMSDFREAMWGVVQQGALGPRLRLPRLRATSTSSGSSAPLRSARSARALG